MRRSRLGAHAQRTACDELSANAKRFIAQSISFVTKPVGPATLDETAPPYLDGPMSMRNIPRAYEALERRVTSANE